MQRYSSVNFHLLNCMAIGICLVANKIFVFETETGASGLLSWGNIVKKATWPQDKPNVWSNLTFRSANINTDKKIKVINVDFGDCSFNIKLTRDV